MATLYNRTGRTGGAASDIDGEDGNNLSDGDICVYSSAPSSDEFDLYMLDADSGATADNLDVIAPATNPGSKRWIRCKNTIWLGLINQSADPPEPASGQCVIWASDGTEKGDAGDVMIAVNVGGTTKVGTLFDYSGGAAW